ncbi:hypothetical protein BN874_360045 [Candidatus Contendobacter odensis Run_B_J11]|uniref:Uncharacterized protein n=1 Tax=Candidatus Contendobacter odensis Run_B_J11 TaxID=1400861 RepID=A0A7U7GDD8_9GAMM|nr:hypothetical protein BN874_360045 [Candidatus Contendobacter odensis Run_B_J11]
MTTQGLLAKVLINKEQGSTGSSRTVLELEAKVLNPFPPYARFQDSKILRFIIHQEYQHEIIQSIRYLFHRRFSRLSVGMRLDHKAGRNRGICRRHRPDWQSEGGHFQRSGAEFGGDQR